MDPMAGKELGLAYLPFRRMGVSFIDHAPLLPTLQQEAESVLAQQDNWSAKGQANQTVQVSWVRREQGEGVVLWAGSGSSPYHSISTPLF